MEVKIVEVGENYIKMIVKGEDHTYLNLLQHYLVENKNVVITKYHIPHPLVGEPELYVRTDGKDPVEVIREANKKIVEVFGSLAKQIE
jgi:DNA-directed RNA polymerase subunit L